MPQTGKQIQLSWQLAYENLTNNIPKFQIEKEEDVGCHLEGAKLHGTHATADERP